MAVTGKLDDLFNRDVVRQLRRDLSLALRAAELHGLSEGVCNHFSVRIPDSPGYFLINPRGLSWGEVAERDIVLVNAKGERLAGLHEVEPTAMFIHAAIHTIARRACVLHTHMPYATAMCLCPDRSLDTRASQNAMRFHGRVAIDPGYEGLALDAKEGDRIAGMLGGADVLFLAHHGVIVCGDRVDYSYEDLYYLERACRLQWIAASDAGRFVRADEAVATRVAAQTLGERAQATFFFESLRRRLPEPSDGAG
jgi:ribulose-5-phosphate 4-epimerase/fuculose-1-phosphate aldolase